MTQPNRTLLLTRPMAGSVAFLSAIEENLGRSVAHVIAPIIEIQNVGSIPDLSGYKTLILTSSYAVKRAGDLLCNKNVATVGKATAALANEFGAHAHSLGGDVEEFLANASELESPCLHLRGVHSRGNLAQELCDRGEKTDEVIIYDQAALQLSADARKLLSSENDVIVPVFSPRSAALLAGYGPFSAEITVIANSSATAASWSAGGNVTVSDAPDLASMVEKTIEML